MGGDRTTGSARRSALGLIGAASLAFAAGCPDTTLGPTDEPSADSGSSDPTIEWRQTIDVGPAGMKNLRGWLRLAPGGTRAYVATWGDSVALMEVADGLLSPPTKLAQTCVNLSDVAFRADGQVAFVGSYYKWGFGCGHALAAFAVQSDGSFGGDALDTAFEGSKTTDPQVPDFSESIALHPSGARLYVGFANTYPANEGITANSQIGRADVAPDGSFSKPELFGLESGDTIEMSLAFSAAGDALYAVQYETGRVNRLHVDGVTGDLTTPAMVTAVGEGAEIGPICAIGGREHVYVGSAPWSHDDPTGGVHHLLLDGTALTSSATAGQTQHPGLFRVHSIVADAQCRYLFVVGERPTTETVLHVLRVDPATGDPIWVSALDGVAQMAKRYRITMSTDGRFLYAVGKFQSLMHVFEIVPPR